MNAIKTSNYLFITSFITIIFVIFLEFYFCNGYFLLPIIHAITAIFSIYAYYRRLIGITAFHCSHQFVNFVLKDPESNSIDNMFIQLMSHLKKYSLKSVQTKIFSMASLGLIILSVFLNIFVSNIFFYIVPIILLGFFFIFAGMKRINPISSKNILDWTSSSISEIESNLLFLKQYEDASISQNFDYLSSNLSQLNEENMKLIKNITLFVKKSNPSALLLLFEEFYKFILKIYELRGMIATLMKIIVKIQHFKFKNVQKMEYLKKKEEDQKMVSLLIQKKENFQALKEEIQQESQKNIEIIKHQTNEMEQYLTQKMKAWFLTLEKYEISIQDKIEEISGKFKEKIDNIANSEYQNLMKKANELREQFNQDIHSYREINDEIKRNQQDLIIKSTEFLMNKLDLGLIEKVDDISYKNFSRFADNFMNEIIYNSDEKIKTDLLLYLCKIHDNL